ncbi:MAG TPA: hypothetical protein VLM40_21160 [Gemmata sp.]|nr:hypothetical protein [Gemmata sp.]
MKQYLASAVVYLLMVAAVAVAQDPPRGDPLRPARGTGAQVQPKATQPGGFGQPGFTRVSPSRMASLEEEVELLEAHRDVRKAIIKAAEVAVKGAEVNLDLTSKANPSQGEIVKAKLEVDAARAQLEIKMAEMKEVEVKIKFAKKRLDDAKKAAADRGPGNNPFRKLDRKEVDPPPPLQRGGERKDTVDSTTARELKKQILILEAMMDSHKLKTAKAAEEARSAKAASERRIKLFAEGRIPSHIVESERKKGEEASAILDKALEEQLQIGEELAKAMAKLKENEK